MTAREATVEAAKIVRHPHCDVRKLQQISDSSGIAVPRLWVLAHRLLKTLA